MRKPHECSSPSISMFFYDFYVTEKWRQRDFAFSFPNDSNNRTKTCYNTFIAFDSIWFMSLNFWIDVFLVGFFFLKHKSIICDRRSSSQNGDALVMLVAKCEMTKNIWALSTLIDWLIWILRTFYTFSTDTVPNERNKNLKTATKRSFLCRNSFVLVSRTRWFWFVENLMQRQIVSLSLYLQGIFFVRNLWFSFLVELHWTSFFRT